MKWIWIVPLVVCLGCGQQPAPSPTKAPPVATNAPAEKSTMNTMIDGITGRQAVQAGQQAKDTIRKVSAQNKQNLGEVTE